MRRLLGAADEAARRSIPVRGGRCWWIYDRSFGSGADRPYGVAAIETGMAECELLCATTVAEEWCSRLPIMRSIYRRFSALRPVLCSASRHGVSGVTGRRSVWSSREVRVGLARRRGTRRSGCELRPLSSPWAFAYLGSMNWQDHITSDKEFLGANPYIKGTRLSVELIQGRLANGWSIEDLLASYPTLRMEDVQAIHAFVMECMVDGMLMYNLPGKAQ